MRADSIIGIGVLGVLMLGLAPTAVTEAMGRVDGLHLARDVSHLGAEITRTSIMRVDAPFETPDAVTCADSPCTRFVEEQLDGVTVSGNVDRWTYQRTDATEFVLTGYIGDRAVVYDSSRGGITDLAETGLVPVEEAP